MAIDNNEYKKVKIFFNGDVQSIKKFVNRASRYNGIEISKGRYTVDGASLMGLFSFDLTEPVIMSYPKEIESDVILDFSEYIINEDSNETI